jgi:hypothetical protein
LEVYLAGVLDRKINIQGFVCDNIEQPRINLQGG